MLTLHWFPAVVRLLVGLPVLLVELLELELDELVLGGGVGVGDELHAARAAARPAAASATHTERREGRPGVVTPPR